MPKRLLVLYLCLYISMIGYGLSLPLLPFFLQELAQNNNIPFSETSLHVGAITAIYAFMQMIFAPLWGKLSDHTGRRKPILLLGLAGYALSLALTGISANISALYIARMISGAFSAAVLPIASAYIVDVADEKHRAKGLAWHGTSVGLGVVSGPALGYYFSDLVRRHPIHFDFIDVNEFSAPFLFVSVLTFLPVVIAGFWLHESVPPTALNAEMETHTERKTLIKSSIALFLILSIVSQFALSLFEGTFVLHAQNLMNINAAQLGSVFMVCGFVMAAAQGTAVAGFIERYGARNILPVGFILMGISLTVLMVVRSMNLVLIIVAILAIGMAIITPSITVLVSYRSENRLGRNLGLLTGANSIGQTLGPLIGSLLFVFNIHLPYLLAAGALFLAASRCLFKQNSIVDQDVINRHHRP